MGMDGTIIYQRKTQKRLRRTRLDDGDIPGMSSDTTGLWSDWFSGLGHGLSGRGVDHSPSHTLDAEPIGRHPMDHDGAVAYPNYAMTGCGEEDDD